MSDLREQIKRVLHDLYDDYGGPDTVGAAIGALAADGLVIVPKEPTEAMTTQGCLAIMDTVLVGPPLIGKSYRAMIAAGGDDD